MINLNLKINLKGFLKGRTSILKMAETQLRPAFIFLKPSGEYRFVDGTTVFFVRTEFGTEWIRQCLIQGQLYWIN